MSYIYQMALIQSSLLVLDHRQHNTVDRISEETYSIGSCNKLQGLELNLENKFYFWNQKSYIKWLDRFYSFVMIDFIIFILYTLLYLHRKRILCKSI